MDQKINYAYPPQEYCGRDDAAIVILPVAYDGTSTWMKGADKGPEAIIEASANMELYDIETDSEVYRRGIFTEDIIGGEISTGEMVEGVAETVGYYIEQNKLAVVIGREHSVSIGAFRAHSQAFDKLTILQLDAHCDLRDVYNGSKYNHACVMARAAELCPVVQVGIRSMNSSEKHAMDRRRVFFARDIHNGTNWVQSVIPLLNDRVYITIDLDVFDPSIMSSTGTPEPGGLHWYDVLTLLRTVCKKRELVGFDVVELCPDTTNKAPDFLAAKLIYKLLSYKFED